MTLLRPFLTKGAKKPSSLFTPHLLWFGMLGSGISASGSSQMNTVDMGRHGQPQSSGNQENATNLTRIHEHIFCKALSLRLP